MTILAMLMAVFIAVFEGLCSTTKRNTVKKRAPVKSYNTHYTPIDKCKEYDEELEDMIALSIFDKDDIDKLL